MNWIVKLLCILALLAFIVCCIYGIYQVPAVNDWVNGNNSIEKPTDTELPEEPKSETYYSNLYLSGGFTKVNCNVETLAPKAFYYYDGLISANFPNLDYLPESAFRGCKNLEVFGTSASSIESYALMGCFNLKKLILTNYTVVCSINFDETYATYSLVNLIKNYNISIYVPNNLVDAYKSAFGWNKFSNQIFSINTLENIDFGEIINNESFNLMLNNEIRDYSSSELTSIRNFAFANFEKVEKINLPNVVEIGEYAFSNTKLLNELCIPLVEYIPFGCFSKSGLTELSLQNCTLLSSSAFDDCNLRYISFDLFAPFDIASDNGLLGFIPESLEKVYVQQEYYNDFINEKTWSRYKSHIQVKGES